MKTPKQFPSLVPGADCISATPRAEESQESGAVLEKLSLP